MATRKTPSRLPSTSPPFDLQVSYRLGAPLVYIKGELDHLTAPRLRTIIQEESSAKPAAVILDMSAVPYMDSGGLSLMYDTLSELKGVGWLGVVSATPPVARLMEITGLTDQPGLRILPDLAAASAALAGIGSAVNPSPELH